MNKHNLTNENYFSIENNMKYMGTSQFKAFKACPAAANGEHKGLYRQEKTPALLVGLMWTHILRDIGYFQGTKS